ncbi:MAG: hypothetical protein EA401_05620 [Planctomycetota bacterium]|nr:MAG: hypothetical protein EA401_05620 [Planctomycetota bacterium]
MTPLDQLYDHAQRPRNMGRMLDAHGTGNVGSIVSGRAMRWFLTMEGEHVAASKFQVFACQEQVAAASILSEWVVGKTVEECLQVRHDDLAASLGGLDRDQFPPQLWAVEALHDALAHISGSNGLVDDLDTLGPDLPLICRCHGTDEATIKELVRGGAHDLAAIQEQSPAGTGCGTCRRDIQVVIDGVVDEPQRPAPSAAAAGAKGRVALMRRIQEVLQPLIDQAASDGIQAIELWDMRQHQVVLRHHASDAEAALAQLQDRGERLLKDEVDSLLTLTLEARPT